LPSAAIFRRGRPKVAKPVLVIFQSNLIFSSENRDYFARPGKIAGRAGVVSLLAMTNLDFFNVLLDIAAFARMMFSTPCGNPFSRKRLAGFFPARGRRYDPVL
jgi:hypothetical protein